MRMVYLRQIVPGETMRGNTGMILVTWRQHAALNLPPLTALIKPSPDKVMLMTAAKPLPRGVTRVARWVSQSVLGLSWVSVSHLVLQARSCQYPKLHILVKKIPYLDMIQAA